MPRLNLKNLESDKPEIKYCCAKQAIVLSEKNPKALYPKIDTFVKLLNSENRILKWTAILVLGNLARADTRNKIDKVVPRLINFLHGKEMITAANSIKALGKIAQTKPRHKEKIFRNFLLVEKARYYNKGRLSPECRNIAIGHVITTLARFRDELKSKKGTITFLKRQTKNTRPATRKKAIELLRRLKLSK